jgi:hypothetical protein
MINANELRIGNWVELTHPFNTSQSIRAAVKSEDILNADKIGTEFHPIPLTPEILEKCGFEKDGEDFFIIKIGRKSFSIYVEDIPDIVYSPDIGVPHNSLNAPIDYLHQLQNLYFSLTGVELNPQL